MLNISFGSGDAFDSLVYGQPSQGTMDYLRSQFTNISDTMLSHGSKLLQQAKDAVEFFNGNAAIDFARGVIKSTKFSQSFNIIQNLESLKEIQAASLTMQRYIMANPLVREMYLGQKLDGYFGTYSNVHGNVIGDQHYDYRRAMDGFMVIEEDDNHYTTYFDELDPDDRELTFQEQIDIQHTWSNVEYLLALGEDDPTSPSGGKL